MSEPQLLHHYSTGERIPMELTPWEQEFFNSLSLEKLCHLVNACHYLEIPQLYHYTSQALASHLKNRSVEEMRQMFAIENSMHDEEGEERIRGQNRWNASNWGEPVEDD